MLVRALVLSLVSSVAFSADLFVTQGEIPQVLIPALTALSKTSPNLLTVDEDSIQVKTELGGVAIECAPKKFECAFDAEIIDGNQRVDQIVFKALLDFSESKTKGHAASAELWVNAGVYQTVLEIRRNSSYNRFNESVRCSAAKQGNLSGGSLTPAVCKFHVARLFNGSATDLLEKLKDTDELRERLATFDKDKAWTLATDASQLSLIDYADLRRQGAREFHFMYSRQLNYATAKHGDVTNVMFKLTLGGKRDDGQLMVDSVNETINRFKKTSP